MPSPMSQARPDALEELRRLSQAQVLAAQGGEVERLACLLGLRQRVLDGLRGRAIPPGQLQEIALRDGETRALLQARIRGLQHDLLQLWQAGRALNGYAANGLAPPGFIDDVR